MGTHSQFRGWEIERIDGVWYFCDSGESVRDSWREKQCGHCGKIQTEEGHDGCLGTLKGIMNACCGHGKNDEAYIQFMDGAIISGDSALSIIAELKTLTIDRVGTEKE